MPQGGVNSGRKVSSTNTECRRLDRAERSTSRRGRIGPVQIFPGTVDRLPAPLLPSATPLRLLGSSASAFAASWSAAAVLWMRQRQQGGQQRTVSAWGKRYALRAVLEFAQLGLRCVIASKLQQPLQVLDNGIARRCSGDTASSETPCAVPLAPPPAL